MPFLKLHIFIVFYFNWADRMIVSTLRFLCTNNLPHIRAKYFTHDGIRAYQTFSFEKEA